MSNITHFPKPDEYSVFKIKHRMDFGELNKTLVLENLNVKEAADKLTQNLSIQGFNILLNTNKIEKTHCLKAFENYGDIVTDVAMPGDVLVFKSSHDNPTMQIAKVLRKAS